MKGIKKYTHKQRQKVIRGLLPLIKKKFGKNLLALAACASYARHEDRSYSDLELVAFVKKMPKRKSWGGMGRIKDGLLVELVWLTRESYIKNTLEINNHWFISGSDTLLPIINTKFIAEISGYTVKNKRKKCLNFAAKNWYEVQEASAKVLNAISQKNRKNLPLLVSDMFLRMLIVLSFLNQRPYTTLSKFVSESEKFKIIPKHFKQLTDIMTKGKYGSLILLKSTVERVFAEFEKIFDAQGLELYDTTIDPAIPQRKNFFKTQ